MNSRPIVDEGSISAIRRAIRADLNRVRADPSLCFDCLVAVTEACTKALAHGYSDGEVRVPMVSWEVQDGVALFRVEDFSPQRWAMARHPSRSSNAVGSGAAHELGIALMRQLMDEVVVDPAPQGTTVTLRKRLVRT